MLTTTIGARFLAIGRVHLIAALVGLAERALAADRVAERAVEARGVFRGIGHDQNPLQPGRVERVADRAHAPIHHVGGSDHIAARLGLDQGVLCPKGTLEALARAHVTSATVLGEVPEMRKWQVDELGEAFLKALTG